MMLWLLMDLVVHEGNAKDVVFAQETPQIQQCFSTVEEVVSIIVQAEEAFVDMDMELFKERRQELIEDLPCVHEVLTQPVVARIHKINMLYWYFPGALDKFGASAQAAHLCDPNLSLTEGLVVNQHPIFVWSEFAIQQQISTPTPIPRPFQHEIIINGLTASDVPTDLPYVFQLIDESGDVSETHFVDLNEELPSYPKWSGDTPISLAFHPKMMLGSVGMATLTIGTLLLANQSANQFWDPTTSVGDLQTLQRRANFWSGTSIVFGVGSAGLLVASGVLGTW